ncbi:hypothetical protein DSECCO2_389050 [anaerobic digester metagenome]
MKKDIVKISVDAEKLRAVKQYMEKKESKLEDELTEQVQKLYEKYVPANVREYIDDKHEEESKVKKSGNLVKTKDESIVQL